jgi:hypothetical protein
MITEWNELIEFVTKQLLIFVVFMCGLIIGYMYGRRDGGG